MKDFTLEVLLAVAMESFGSLFWPTAAVVVFFLLLFVRAFARRKSLPSSTSRYALIAGAISAALAAILAPALTQASFTNLHGSVDYAALALIVVSVFCATAIAAFAVLGNLRGAV